MTQTDPAFRVTFLLFDNVTQLDATGPLEVFASTPGFTVKTVAKNAGPVKTACGLKLLADHTFDAAPETDIFCIPGGPGVNPLLTDDETIAFIRRSAGAAQYVVSVCTGALLLGAAGLLNGRSAATHWMSMHFLEAFGSTPVHERVVFDGKLVTGGGVTAGVDVAFTLIDRLCGRDVAALTMLALEYDPSPPFSGGSVATAPPAIVDQCRQYAGPMLDERAQQITRAISKYASNSTGTQT